MSRFTRKIRQKNKNPIQVVILAAGASARTRSYEPRCLLRYKDQTLIESQLTAVDRHIPKYEASIVVGVEQNKLLKKLDRKIRVVENVRHEDTNSGESLRLGFNASVLQQFLFVHGDLFLDEDFFKKISFDESFVLVDSYGLISSKEVGVSDSDGYLVNLCYSVTKKWCQVVFLGQQETKILERMLWKDSLDTTHLLSFEVINAIVQNGGQFRCIEIENKFIREVDSLKDLQYENFSRKQNSGPDSTVGETKNDTSLLIYSGSASGV